MTDYTIYGIRLIGELEVRYVGQTQHSAGKRLAAHLSLAKAMPAPDAFAQWLVAHQSQIEVIVIDVVPTREMARLGEGSAIRLLAKVGHRLFNRHHMPPSLRVQRREPGFVGVGWRYDPAGIRADAPAPLATEAGRNSRVLAYPKRVSPIQSAAA